MEIESPKFVREQVVVVDLEVRRHFSAGKVNSQQESGLTLRPRNLGPEEKTDVDCSRQEQLERRVDLEPKQTVLGMVDARAMVTDEETS